MKRKPIQNLAASVHARLLRHAELGNEDFQFVLMRYGVERLMYPRETVVAEKFEAMVKLGLANSRMKDFYDIWALSREFDFDGGVLSAAIQATFKRRKTALTPTMPLALTSEFSRDPLKQTQWKAFVGRSKLRLAGEGLERVVAEIRKFMEAPVVAASKKDSLKAVWAKRGPWRPS